MLQLKSCARCQGDMVAEEWQGDVELVCLRCGYRMPLPRAQRPAAEPVEAGGRDEEYRRAA